MPKEPRAGGKVCREGEARGAASGVLGAGVSRALRRGEDR